MTKNILIYVAISILLLSMAVLFFFNRAYRELMSYSELTNRHNTVHALFQSLGREINSAAVLTPELAMAIDRSGPADVFDADSLTVLKNLTLLQESVRDSVNISIAKNLLTIVSAELGWLIRSNVPDSIIKGHGKPHLARLRQIDSLIKEGITRTDYIIEFRKKQITTEMARIRMWMALFIVVSALMLVVTTFNLVTQRSKTKSKEKELEVLLNRMSDGVASLDNNWRYTFMNDAAVAAYPAEKKEIIGKTIWEVHPEVKDSVFWQKYQEAASTKKPVEVDGYYPSSRQWYSVKVYPSANGLTLFYKNITDKKLSEEKLSQTQQELNDYKYALDESSIVATTDQKGKILYVNDNFCKISKYSREELIGQDHRIINSGYHSKAFIRGIWVSIANGRIWKGELKNRAKDGTIYWVDTTIVPFLDEAGKPYRYVAIRADITERKIAEQKLIQSEKIYKTIASSIPGTVICLINPEYRYLLIEGDMLEKLGHSKDRLLGNKAQDVLSPEAFRRIKPNMERAFSGNIITVETNQAGYDIISRYIPLKDENDKVYAIMTVAIDITELKNAQRNIANLNNELEEKIIRRTEELKKSNEEMEAFSYSVSHDLRAPLRGIIGFASILEEDYEQKMDDEGKRLIAVIKENTMKMGNLIDDLLAFSRLGKQGIIKTKINTSGLVADIIREQSQTIEKSITWDVRALPGVEADLNTIRQVWINLISNAIKYSRDKERPRIEVGSRTEKNQIVFYVRDNGVGFDEAYKHKLFRVFQRLHNADEFEGTGVGLAIVQKIVSRHGGDVWAEGQEGEGACFYFTLPV